MAFPMFFFVKTCVDETQAITSRFQTFVQNNEEFQIILDDFGNSPPYKWLQSYATSWGWTVPPFDKEVVKQKLIGYAMGLSAQLTDVLGSLVNVIFDSVKAVVSFAT
jgi:hypothetical protein